MLVACFPDGIAPQALHGPDAGLAAMALLREGLHGFEPVESVGVGCMVGERDDLFDPGAARDVGGWVPPRFRAGRNRP